MAKRTLLPLLDRVLVRRIKAQDQISGVIVPESAQSRLNEAVVVATGPGRRDKDGAIIPVSVKEGEAVLLPEYGGSTVKLDGDELVMFRDEDILGVLKDK